MIVPKDHISVDGDEYVLFDSNSRVETRFPTTAAGAGECLKMTCGYFSITTAAKNKMEPYLKSS